MGACSSEQSPTRVKSISSPPGAGRGHVRRVSNSRREQLILGRYCTSLTTAWVLGEGTSSICYKGTDTKTGQHVAIKLYKATSDKVAALKQFRRQVEVMKELQQPFDSQTTDGNPGSPWLLDTKPSDLFVQLLDYSTTTYGTPGPDPVDGSMYVVMELAQESFLSYLKRDRERQDPPQLDVVRRLSRDVVMMVAGLHAKGFVHLDIKPANIMMCGSRLKLIDLDGCIRIGERVSITDSSISFSPVYCAPEWAKFMVDSARDSMCVDPGIDVWSVGMTLCEFVTRQPCLKSAWTTKQSRFDFFERLAAMEHAPLPESVHSFDREFADLLASWMLVGQREQRRSLEQCLSHPFFSEAASEAASGSHHRRRGAEEEEELDEPRYDSDGSTTASSGNGRPDWIGQVKGRQDM